MRALVTGAAGFIGSHLVDALLARGDAVTGIDCLTPFYVPADKLANLDGATSNPRFELVRTDLTTATEADLADLVAGADAVFHLAAQPGIGPSWDRFADYLRHNLLATQCLLEAAAARPRRSPPTTEDQPPRPHNPYGVTKLAAEHLCLAYAANFGLAPVLLRYFTVYGPRQRPDMAIHRMCEAALGGRPFRRYGEANQIRDFTHVSDVVAATMTAADAALSPGATINVAGGSSVGLKDVIELVGRHAGTPVPVVDDEARVGDVHRTGAETERATKLLAWRPQVALADGLADQLAWHRRRRALRRPGPGGDGPGSGSPTRSP
ncbi:MAG: NAD-dependent epimerase/dehydratase family protein [Acidimicrobiales bacterium]